jgi:hypothetical protein
MVIRARKTYFLAMRRDTVPLSLTFGSDSPIDLLNLSDLQTDLNTVLKTGDEFKEYLGGKVSAVPNNLNSAILNYSSGDQTWKPSNGPLTFTLSGGASTGITIVQSGSLLKYTTGFPVVIRDGLSTGTNGNNTASIDAQPGKSYVKISLQFTLSVSAGLTYTSGIWGVNATGKADSTLVVEFIKEVGADTNLQTAIEQAFGNFTLPLHAGTLKNLKQGDLVHYTFNATLQVSMGASISPPSFSYAAKGSLALPGAANVAGVTGSINPEVSAGVKSTFSCNYSGSFEALVRLTNANTANLHIYRGTQVQTGVDLNASLSISANATGTATISPDAAVGAATNALAGAVPILAPVVQGAKLASSYSNAMTKWASEVNSKVAAWLGKANNLGAQIDGSINANRQNFILADYSIDLTKNYGLAWDAMTEGRFYDALGMSGTGVTLATGNGLESLYNRTASFSLNFFGNFGAKWSTAYIQNSTLTYAGNNVFHLNAAVGDQLLSNVGSLKQEIDIYFAADLDLTNASAPIDPSRIKLHLMLQGTDDKTLGGNLATILNTLATGPSGLQLSQAMHMLSQQAGTTLSLHLIFGKTAFDRIAYSLKTKPPSDGADRVNYAVYQKCCGSLYGSTSPANFLVSDNPLWPLSYDVWSDCFIASNDIWPPMQGTSPVPDRKYDAVYNSNVLSALQDHFSSNITDDGVARLIFYTLKSAAQFMNLCQDLNGLAALPMTEAASTWKDLVTELTKMIKNDVNTDFIPAAGFALACLCGTTPSTVSGPIASLPAGTSLSVTLTY